MKLIQTVFILLLLGSCQTSNIKASSSFDKAQPDYALLQKELEEIYDLDQNVRNVDWDSLEADSAILSAYILKMWKIDTTNQGKVLTILEKHGWLPKSKVGEKASQAIYYVVQHSDLKTIEKYLPQMEKLAQQGEANATNAASMRDRLLMFQGKKQIYGTQARGWMHKKGSFIWPIEDVANVNKRRKKMGFTTTVEENAKRLEAAFDPNQELPGKEYNMQQ